MGARIKQSAEPVRVIGKSPEWIEGDFRCQVCYFSDGGEYLSKHPLHPKRSREEVLADLGRQIAALRGGEEICTVT